MFVLFFKFFLLHVQWNLSIVDTTGPRKYVLIRSRGVLISEVVYKSNLRNCPAKRGVLAFRSVP